MRRAHPGALLRVSCTQYFARSQ